MRVWRSSLTAETIQGGGSRLCNLKMIHWLLLHVYLCRNTVDLKSHMLICGSLNRGVKRIHICVRLSLSLFVPLCQTTLPFKAYHLHGINYIFRCIGYSASASSSSRLTTVYHFCRGKVKLASNSTFARFFLLQTSIVLKTALSPWRNNVRSVVQVNG